MCWNSRDKTAMDFKNISELLSLWVIICSTHSQDSKSQLTKLAPSLLFSPSVFFSGSFPTSLFVFHFSFCLLLYCATRWLRAHCVCFILGNWNHYPFYSVNICLILWRINCLLFTNRQYMLARRLKFSSIPAQLGEVKCGLGCKGPE